MARILTERSTQSLYLKSINNEILIEEQLSSIANDVIPLEKVIPYLMNHHSFTYFNSKGMKMPCTVYFTESLNILHIITTKNLSKKVFTPDILEITAGAALKVKRESEFIYPINIKTRSKTILIGCTKLHDRDYWSSCAVILMRYAKECFSSLGLRRYCDTVVMSRENEALILQMRDLQSNEWLEVGKLEKLVAFNEKEVISALLGDLICQLELTDQQQAIKSLEKKVLTLIGDKFLLKQSQGNLARNLQQKESEIYVLTEAYTSIRSHYLSLTSKYFLTSSWKAIISFMSFNDLLVLKNVSRSLRRLICSYLKTKSNWKRLVSCSLFPRKISWRSYINIFYDTEIAAMGQEVLPTIIEEISQDVVRGLPDHFAEVEEVLIGVCSLFPHVGYCQGMQQVAHFLLWAFRDSNEVLGTMLSLLRPPYYLGDLWKTGFTRLKLAIFQLKYLLKLKLPIMAKHLTIIDMKLDIIVTPWLLTVFTCLISKQIPPVIVRGIWDFFLVYGWPALISTCLALFNIYQSLILELDLEKTLKVFSESINCNSLLKDITRFEVSQDYLDELEKAFCLKKDPY